MTESQGIEDYFWGLVRIGRKREAGREELTGRKGTGEIGREVRRGRREIGEAEREGRRERKGTQDLQRKQKEVEETGGNPGIPNWKVRRGKRGGRKRGRRERRREAGGQRGTHRSAGPRTKAMRRVRLHTSRPCAHAQSP